MRMPAWLFTLLAAAFVLYTDDYVIAGILPELAADLGVTEGQAGQLVTMFSLTVALTAPVAAVVLAAVPRRRLFTTALLVFMAANLAAAATDSFAVLTALRVAAALTAAAMTPALFAFTARHAPAQKVGRYLAIVSLGVTGSISAGVPLGTWIGGVLGWRATFATMAIAGALVFLLVLSTLPRSEETDDTPRLADQFRILRRAPISLGLMANCLLMTGSMMMLTYLAPLPGRDHNSRHRRTRTRLQPLRDRRHWRHLARRDRYRPPRRESNPADRYRHDRRHDDRPLGALDSETRSTAARAGRRDAVGRHGVLDLPSNPSPPAPPRRSRLGPSAGAEHFRHLPRGCHRSRGWGQHPLNRWYRSSPSHSCSFRDHGNHFARLHTCCPMTFKTDHGTQRIEVHSAITEMRRDLSHKWTLAELAQYAHISPSRLKGLFVDELLPTSR